MEMKVVNSSNITHVGYEADKHVLHVTFSSGKTYYYSDVPQRLYEGLISTYNPGSYFARNIRPYFTGRVVS